MSERIPGRITDIVPTGSNVLVELLNLDETLGTKLTLTTSKAQSKDEARQAYVLAIGPAAQDGQYGFKVGDRVILSGMGVPMPKYGDDRRDRVLLEPHTIKAVIKDSILEVN